MREIKFRAWHPEEKKMWEDVGTDGCGGIILDTENRGLKPLKGEALIMQYTGLKDKNGTLIFEGDIVREDSPYTSFSSGLKVIFEQKLLQFGVAEIDNYFTPLSDIKGYWEVIGNIYENEELLEVK